MAGYAAALSSHCMGIYEHDRGNGLAMCTLLRLRSFNRNLNRMLKAVAFFGHKFVFVTPTITRNAYVVIVCVIGDGNVGYMRKKFCSESIAVS